MFGGSKKSPTFASQLRNKPSQERDEKKFSKGFQKKCPDGGIGRRAGLKHQWIHFHPGSTPGLGTRIKAKC